MKFEVTVLGSNSATALYGRHHTAQVLNHNDSLFLIDCGEGTQMQLQRYAIRAARIRHIFISHLHGDHYLGLVGLISSMHLNGRKDPLYIYGQSVLLEIIDIQLKASETDLRYKLVFQAIDAEVRTLLMENEFLEVYSFPLSHRIPCCGFLFIEKPRLPKINDDLAASYNIPKSFYKLLKRGIAFEMPDGKKN